MKQKKTIQKPENTDKVLLHACCAPCSTAITEWMLKNDVKPTIFFYNPNIYPKEEYDKRRDESKRHAEMNGIEWIEGPWNHEEWKAEVRGHEKDPERGDRCQICFNMRMRKAAETAEKMGLETLATTLATSRWKRLEQVDTAGEMAVKGKKDVKYWKQNWRVCGLQERRNELIKAENFYNQLYCGCEYSMRKDEE